MTDPISISLKNVQNIKSIKIEEIGDFTIRRLGPGEEYDLSSKRRRMVKIADEMTKIKEKIDALTDASEQEKVATEHLPAINQLSEEIADIQKYELDVYKGCFTDDNGGKNVDKLLDSLTTDERMKLYDMVFNVKEKTESDA